MLNYFIFLIYTYKIEILNTADHGFAFIFLFARAVLRANPIQNARRSQFLRFLQFFSPPTNLNK